MSAIILFLSFILIFFSNLIFFSKKKEEYFRDIRLIFLSSAIIWSSIMALGTELLSVFNKLNYSGIIVFWSLISVVFGSYLYQQKNILKQKTKEYLPIKTPVNFLTISIFLILSVTLFIALYSPSNNWDSMTYHMSRVAYWQQNENLNHFATHSIRQIALQPLAEIFILHFRVLCETDLFVNFVQWFSFLGSVIGISYIAYLFKADKKTQLLSAFIGVTIPMTILQASSTQNDLVNSFFCICFVIFIILLIKTRKNTFVIFSGLSLGLALLTKGTAYIYTFPFVLYYIISNIKQDKAIKLKFVKSGLIISFITLILNFGYFYRNISDLSHPFGDLSSISFENELHTPSALISNVSRNLANHLSFPNEKMNKPIISGLKNLHEFLGLEIDDKQTTYVGKWHMEFTFNWQEDLARNFFHTIFILLIIFSLIFSKKYNYNIKIYALLLILASLLFCFYLKWQPWHSRLQTPLFLLFSPLLAIYFNKRKKMFLKVIILILLFQSLFPLFLNRSRCIFPSNRITKRYIHRLNILPSIVYYDLINYQSMLFLNNEELTFLPLKLIGWNIDEDYKKVINYCKENKIKKLGLIIGGDTWDYPFFFLKKINPDIEIKHVNVRNNSKNLENKNFIPDCIIAVKNKTKKDIIYLKTNNIKYDKVLNTPELCIYKKNE